VTELKILSRKRMTVASVYPTIISQKLLKVSPNATYNLLKIESSHAYIHRLMPTKTSISSGNVVTELKILSRKRMTVASVYPTIISQNLLKVSPNATYNLLKIESSHAYLHRRMPTKTSISSGNVVSKLKILSP
jgi:hypothetical protein